MPIVFSMNFKVSTKNLLYKAALAKLVAWAFLNFGVDLKSYVSKIKVQQIDMLRICDYQEKVDMFLYLQVTSSK